MDGKIIGGTALTIYGLKDILPELYRDLLQPGARKMGSALEEIIGYGTNILSFYGEKQRILIQARLNQYAQKLESIPDGNIAKVPPEIGIPIFQRLSYYVSNEELADLFLELLTRASSLDACALAQPSFISIIERLSIDEAKILKYIADNNMMNIYFSIVIAQSMGDHLRLTPPLTGIEKKLSLVIPENINVYFDNLISLRIIENAITPLYREMDDYRKIEELYGGEDSFKLKYKDLPKVIEHQADIRIMRGSYRVTSMGLKFIECCMGKKMDGEYNTWGNSPM